MATDFVSTNVKEVIKDVALELPDEDEVLEADQERFSVHSSGLHASVGSKFVRRRGLARYSSAVKYLLPFRSKGKENNVIEVDNAGLFSLMIYSWMSKYIFQAYKSGLTINDIPLCSPYDSCDSNAQRLEALWQTELNEKGSTNASFGKTVWLFIRTRLLVSSFVYIISCLLGFLSPAIFMRKLIEYAQDSNGDTVSGLTWALAFTFCELFKTLSLALAYSISYRTAIRLRAACLLLVYKKLVHINSLGAISTGEVINLYGADAGRLSNMVIFGPMVIGGPIAVICCASYIYFILGVWPLLGLAAFLLFYPLQYLLSRLTGIFRERTIRKTDERLKLMTELLTTIKLVKMYAWETCFMKRIHDVRNEELFSLERASYCQSIGISLAPTVPVISGILIIITHVLSGGNLIAAEAYPLVTLLHSQLRSSLLNLRYGSENIIDGQITFARIKEILVLEEVEPNSSLDTDSSFALYIDNGIFTRYNSAENFRKNFKSNKEKILELEKLTDNTIKNSFMLDSVTLSVPKGSLIGICGAVGSGKTSLIHACLGQMKMIGGQMSKSGSTAYVSQESWIENTTLKENILFGEPFEARRYINTLHCCALNEDVNLLPAGDETQIGERGVNLSGGQKQRISLARALYSNKDIYFLDDPFSAVDWQVGNHIFEKCILDALSEKTVFLVTHQMKYLKKCQQILVMKDGKITERGTHDELMSMGREYSHMVQSSTLINWQGGSDEDKKNTDKSGNQVSNGRSINKNKNTQSMKFTTSEEQIKGVVGSFAYNSYIKSAGGFFICFIVVVSILLNVGSIAFSSWWLAFWIKAGSGNTTTIDPVTNETVISSYINDNPDLNFYMETYAWIIGVICATSVLRGIIFTKVTMRASRKLHKFIFEKLIHAHLSHFETTPIGRIQNIFSRDLGEVDDRLPGAMEMMIQNMCIVAFAFFTISLVFPWFLIALAGLALLYYVIGKMFRISVRDLKRIEAIARAPIFSSISSTLNGFSVIQAFNKEADVVFQFCKKFDLNSVCVYLSCCAMRWLALRLDFISVAVVVITSMLVVILKGEVAPSLAGLALTYAAHISGVLQYTLRLMTETEGRFIAVERMLLFVRNLGHETNVATSTELSSGWPMEGSIRFHNVKLRYSDELPPVLNGVSFAVKGGEKIGIVGRTGAGKSSLIAALFRLVNVSQGAIFIDGIDISSISLEILRSRLSVIAQEPVVFSGTVRFNLDPFNKHKDNVIWKALWQTKLFDKVQSLPNGLYTLIGEGGESLSVGEKQLLCLARAVLQSPKILVLDEATASIDPDTESDVQTTLDEHFTSCTVLTIAHRLTTIKRCDKVLVIDKGMIQEFDAPSILLSCSNSLLAKMVKAGKN